MGRVIFFEPLTPAGQSSPTCQAFVTQFPAHASHTDVFPSIEAIVAGVQRAPADAVILLWELSQWPHWDLEEFWQHPVLSAIPLIIVQEKMDAEDRAFVAEYGHEQPLAMSSNLTALAKQIHEHISKEHNERLPETRMRIKARRFFHKLHNEQFDEAEQYLEGHGDSFCTALEKDFYLALVKKTKKEFEAAVQYLTNGLKQVKGQANLAAKFLHLVGNIALKRQNYDQALRFLEAANKVSPKNLRRRFLLAQCYLEMGRQEQALKEYNFIHQLCPNYPGIHVRMAELRFQLARSIDEIEAISSLLFAIQDRELVSLYKRLPKTETNAAEHRKILDLLVREFSLRANKFIEGDDFYAALKPYKHIEKIIDGKDSDRQQALSYCYARVYYRASDFDLADEHLAKAMTLSKAVNPKHQTLKELIDKGRKGSGKNIKNSA